MTKVRVTSAQLQAYNDTQDFMKNGVKIKIKHRKSNGLAYNSGAHWFVDRDENIPTKIERKRKVYGWHNVSKKRMAEIFEYIGLTCEEFKAIYYNDYEIIDSGNNTPDDTAKVKENNAENAKAEDKLVAEVAELQRRGATVIDAKIMADGTTCITTKGSKGVFRDDSVQECDDTDLSFIDDDNTASWLKNKAEMAEVEEVNADNATVTEEVPAEAEEKLYRLDEVKAILEQKITNYGFEFEYSGSILPQIKFGVASHARLRLCTDYELVDGVMIYTVEVHAGINLICDHTPAEMLKAAEEITRVAHLAEEIEALNLKFVKAEAEKKAA